MTFFTGVINNCSTGAT